MPLDSNAIASVAKKAVKTGGHLALDHFHSGLIIDKKADASLVSQADRDIEKLIIGQIHDVFPNHHIYGEESGGNLDTSQPVWIIDPIEGTTNYLHGIPIFGTQLAVFYRQDIIVSAMYDPIGQNLLWAQKSAGAYLNDQQIKLINQPLTDVTVLFDTGRDKTIVSRFYQSNLLTQFRSFRRLGSLVTDTVFLTHRFFSAYFCFSGKIYDLAPSSLILKESGYSVFDASFSFWHPSLINHLFACHPKHFDQLKSLLQPIIK